MNCYQQSITRRCAQVREGVAHAASIAVASGFVHSEAVGFVALQRIIRALSFCYPICAGCSNKAICSADRLWVLRHSLGVEPKCAHSVRIGSLVT